MLSVGERIIVEAPLAWQGSLGDFQPCWSTLDLCLPVSCEGRALPGEQPRKWGEGLRPAVPIAGEQ